ERWGRVVQERVAADIEAYYRTDSGDEPLFYIWARTVRCQNPACRVEIPLVGSFYLIKKSDYIVALLPRPSTDRQSIDFEVVENPDPGVDLDAGIITRANAVCPCCNQTTSAKEIKERGKAGDLGHRLIA